VEEEMMQQELRLILLKERNEFLLGKITEMDEEPSILIENCYEIRGEDELVPFPPYSSQRDLFLTSEAIFTILEPSAKFVEIYNKL
jgi:hypothetical protein